MNLHDELAERRELMLIERRGIIETMDAANKELLAHDERIDDLTRAIAALEPLPIDEKASWEPPADVEPVEAVDLFEAEPVNPPETHVWLEPEHVETPEVCEPDTFEIDKATALAQLEADAANTAATNPEADAIARAHEWYDPQAVAERERNAGLAKLFSYNPFYKSKVDA